MNNNRIVFDDFKKENKRKKENRQIDEDEFAVVGGKITENGKKNQNVTRQTQATGGWGDATSDTMQFLVGKEIDEQPKPKRVTKGVSKFINTQSKNINWNTKLEGAPERKVVKVPPRAIGMWDQPPQKSEWNVLPKSKGKGNCCCLEEVGGRGWDLRERV